MSEPSQANEPQPTFGERPTTAGINLPGSLAALRRAALHARQVAQQTGTDLILVRAGKVVRVPPLQKPTP